jgi:hypothetical protein
MHQLALVDELMQVRPFVRNAAATITEKPGGIVLAVWRNRADTRFGVRNDEHKG